MLGILEVTLWILEMAPIYSRGGHHYVNVSLLFHVLFSFLWHLVLHVFGWRDFDTTCNISTGKLSGRMRKTYSYWKMLSLWYNIDS